MTGFMASYSNDTVRQRKRHQMLVSSTNTITSPKELPKDTLGAIHYLLDLLHPLKVRQRKIFPRACMIHQIYSIINDHTTVDRALAQLINENTIRKFYLGGTGSDEFAIMLTSDYVEQIQQAKEQYLKDIQGSGNKKNSNNSSPSSSSPSSLKRKAEASSTITDHSSRRTSDGNSSNKKLIAENAIIDAGSKIKQNKVDGISKAQSGAMIFDRFKDLILSGQCLEISIQHSNIQSAIGASDQDITTLIHYSLINRSLSAPANPHLVNLNQSESRGRVANSSSSSSHSALNNLIHSTNQEQSKSIKPETEKTALGSNSGSGTVNQTMTITASISRSELISDDVSYRFAIRNGGLFVTHYLKGRLEILRMIRRQTFGDMLGSIIISKPLRGSFLPHEFHIHDIVGSGRVRSDQTSSGQMLKLTQKGEASAKAK